jgi:hypothetical protein
MSDFRSDELREAIDHCVRARASWCFTDRFLASFANRIAAYGFTGGGTIFEDMMATISTAFVGIIGVISRKGRLNRALIGGNADWADRADCDGSPIARNQLDRACQNRKSV